MSIQSPPTLLELAGHSMLSDKSRAILDLEDLPIEFFPPLFVEAFRRGHTEVLKKMRCGFLLVIEDWSLRDELTALFLLRHLKTPLETLAITNCPLSHSDWNYLSCCPNTSQLRHLDLRYITLTNFSPEPLKILLETVAATLKSLDLEACEMTDSQLQAILPALSRCSKLRILCLFGNRISMSVLRDLLLHTARLSQLSIELYPAPLESYDAQGAIYPGRCSQLCAELTAILKDFRQPNVLIFRTVSCPQCGRMFLYNQGLIHCSCPTAA
uniref:PRAME family member 12-like n=1 Tax=Ictidomys tridecemlineatus TaxID=43179 RepID=UPI001A9D676D|nr:PRAME family member 12-like [Ictidomys tridecemlineatus]